MKHYIPQTIPQLFEALNELEPQGKIIGGGTDLTPMLYNGKLTPASLLYLGNTAELRQIELKQGKLEIGAAATMRELAASPLLRGPFRAVADAAADVGSQQIRNKATLGGNVANASPAGDLLPTLFLLEAQAVLAIGQGKLRTLPMKELVLGPSRTALGPNEAIVRFTVEANSWHGYESAFVKLGFRQKVTISRIGMAVALKRDAGGIIEDARVYAGAVSLTPLRMQNAEEVMRGKRPDEALAAELARLLAALIQEITPLEFDRDYKVEAARGITEDVLKRFRHDTPQ